jgi:hypothetical protein
MNSQSQLKGAVRMAGRVVKTESFAFWSATTAAAYKAMILCFSRSRGPGAARKRKGGSGGEREKGVEERGRREEQGRGGEAGEPMGR